MTYSFPSADWIYCLVDQYVLRQAPPTDGVIKPYPLPERSEGPHFAYAVQWGVFTLIAIGGYPLVIRRVARGGGKDRKDDVPTDPDDLDAGGVPVAAGT